MPDETTRVGRWGLPLRPRTRLARVLTALTLTLLGLLVGPGAAAAGADGAPGPSPLAVPIHIEYGVIGTASLPGISGTGPLTEGTMAIDLYLRTGSLTGTVTLPDFTVKGLMFGFAPTELTLGIAQAGDMGGQMSPQGKATVTVPVTLAVKSMRVFDAMEVARGTCRTTNPHALTITSDGRFDSTIGGPLSARFPGGALSDCGRLSQQLTAIVGNSGNRLDFRLKLRT